MWWVITPYLVVGLDVSFKNFGDGYIEVVADGVSCNDDNQTFVLQHSYDSSRIRGSAQNPLPKDQYGSVKNAEDAAYASGMFIPEFNTGTSSRSIEEMWLDWATRGIVQDAEVYSFKYSPTGKIYLRQAGSRDANEALGKALSQLPGLPSEAFNYSKFDQYYSEPWSHYEGKNYSHEAYPGMMPVIHPVYQKSPQEGGHQKYAVKSYPGSTSGQCCLVVEGQKTENQKVNPVGYGIDATLEGAESGAHLEFSLSWRQLASHTSFSRGVPDLFFYTPAQLKTDFSRRPRGTEQNLLDQFQNALTSIKGSGFSSNTAGNEFKCRKPSEDSLANNQQPNDWSFYTASRLEHFYSAVVGAKEAGMLRQKISEWDGANVDIDNYGSTGDSADGNGQWNPDCSKQPGGHCGFGYYCASAEAGGNWDGCPQFRWRGRPEAIRFDGDNSAGEIPAATHPFNSTWTTYPHVLDGESGPWYDAEYRMSARLVFTGGDGHSQETELPCAITNYIDVVDNVVGDFSRACSKLRATKFEWLIAAMLQGHKYESEDFNRNGKNDQGYWWENGRGVGPTPCTYNSEICYMNNRNNRVKMWDMDETWDLHTNNNRYIGAEVNISEDPTSPDNTYFKRLKNLRQVPGVGIPVPPGEESFNTPQPPMFRQFVQSDTQYGASDGTSRTDPHAMSCYISPHAILPTSDGDNDYFNRYGDSNTYYIAKPSLWPFQWGLSRSIGSDVDWNAPAGCDIYYGPPCLFTDARQNLHYSASYTGKHRRMAGKTQGTDGVMTCGRIIEEGTRSTWDTQSKSSRNENTHGSHTCSNLGNATHFKISDLDEGQEEYDFRATTYHKYGIRNCNVGYCQDAPISIGCHFPMNDQSTETHTFFFEGTVDGKNYSWFAFNNKNRGAPEKDSYNPPIADAWAARSANGKVVNPNVAWVNWGKKFETIGEIQVGERLSNMHTPYQDGKKDGILECGRPAEDLLLYSLAKSVQFCVNGNENFTEISACRKPGNYAEWLQNHGEFEKGLTIPNPFDSQLNSGRYNQNGVKKDEGDGQLTGKCTENDIGCDCGFLARTTRIVVGPPNHGFGDFTESRPYAPTWVNNPDTTWCTGNPDDRAFKPRRVCSKQNLFQTPFWSGSPISLSENFPSALEQTTEQINFVRRQNSVWNLAELEQMKLCANSDDGQVCNKVPDVLLGSAVVSVKNSASGDVQLALPLEDGQNCQQLDQDIAAFKGFDLSKVGLADPLAFTAAAGPPHYCLLVNGNNGPTNPGLWQINLKSDGTIDSTVVENSIDEYELLRITQCLDGSQSCPKVVTQKLMNIGVPTDLCNGRPRISYACEEEDDNGNLVQQTPQLDFLSDTSETSETGVHKFTHLISEKCLNHMNFFIQCDDSSELSALHTSLCGSTNGCELPETFKMCSYNPFTSNKFRKFKIFLPDNLFYEDALDDEENDQFTPENCACSESLLIFENQQKLCYTVKDTNRAFSSSLRDLQPFLCTSTYRVVELRDYRPDLALQVAWGACDSLRVKYSGEEEFPGSVIEPTKGFSPNGGDFRADLPVPLSRQSSERYGEGGFTWKSGPLRELVPQGCRNKFQTASSAIFSRRIAFDNNPGEPMSLHEYGKCPNTEEFCNNKEDVYIKNVQMFETDFVQPMKQHYGRADDCPLFCKGTFNCTAVSFDPATQLCSLYRNISGVVRLDVVDTGSIVEDTFDNALPGVEAIFVCIGPEIQQVFPPPPPVAPLRLCPSGHSLVQFPGSPSKCVRSTCNPETEMGVHLFPKKECTGECYRLCNNAPGRELDAHTANRPAIWNILDPPTLPANVDYSYSPLMRLEYRPTFEFAFNDVASLSVSELKQIEIFLPPTRIVNCSELQNITSEMIQEQIQFSWSLRVADSNQELASGTGTHNTSFLLKDTHELTEIIIGDNIDIPVESYSSLRLNITTEQVQPMKHAIMFVVEGSECPCETINRNGTGVTAYTQNQLQAFQSNTTLYQNESAEFHCKTVYSEEPVATYGNAGFSNLKVCNIAPDPEVCMPHTPCKDREEYLEHPGNLENDNICAKQRFCFENEYENTTGTPTSVRECVLYRECTSLEYETLAATPTTQRQCEYLEPCASETQYKNRETNECVQISECSEEAPKIGTAATPYSDVECTTYTIECSETQYETNPRTSSTEKVCTEATICAPQEYSSLEASLTSDRKCTPMLECSVHQIEHSPSDFQTDVFCEPVVHFSIAWFMGITYCVVFATIYFWVVFGRARYMEEPSILE